MMTALVARMLAALAVAAVLACSPAAAQSKSKGQTFTVVESGAYVRPAPLAPPVPTWSFDASKTLHEILSEWATKAGWVAVFEPGAAQIAQEFKPAVGGSLKAADFKSAITEFMGGLDSSVALTVELRTGNAPQILYVTKSR